MHTPRAYIHTTAPRTSTHTHTRTRARYATPIIRAATAECTRCTADSLREAGPRARIQEMHTAMRARIQEMHTAMRAHTGNAHRHARARRRTHRQRLREAGRVVGGGARQCASGRVRDGSDHTRRHAERGAVHEQLAAAAVRDEAVAARIGKCKR